MKQNGIKCANCDRHWQWDWCQDTFRENLKDNTPGEYCPQLELKKDDSDMFTNVVALTVHQCFCNGVIAITISGDDGAMNFDRPENTGIDWELEEYSAPGNPYL